MAEKSPGKKTALQAAEERKKAKNTAFDVRQLLLGAMVLFLLMGSAMMFQVAQLLVLEYQHARVDRSGQALARHFGEMVADTNARLLASLDADQVLRAARNQDEPSRQLAEVAMREQVPELRRVEFYPFDAERVLDRDLAEFGYAKAEMLVTTIQRDNHSELQVHGLGRDRRHMARALVIRSPTGTRLGVAYVDLPIQPYMDMFSGVSAGGGYLDFRQRGGRGGDLIITSLQSTNAPVHADLLEFPVPGTLFRVHGGTFERFMPTKVDSVAIALSIAVALLLLAVAMLWLRLNWGSIGKAKVAAAEPTLASLQVEEAQASKTGRKQKAATKKNGEAETGTDPATAAPGTKTPVQPAPKTVSVDRSIFRSYDVRGVVGKHLNADVARMLGRAVGSLAQEMRLSEFVVGRDARDSSPELSDALIEGLRASGCDVIDIGMVTTPMVYFACFHLNTGSGVMVTGSHNAPEYNGFKMVVGGQSLSEEQIHELYSRIAEARFSEGQGGLQSMDMRGDYMSRISGDVQLELPLKVVVDCANASPGAIAPEVLSAIGCEVEPLFCDIDSSFPNHHPDPADPANLRDLALVVKQVGADIGIALDGDGDRLGVVTAEGKIVSSDRLLMLFSMDLLSRNPGASIIYDVKCTSHLSSVILSHGGSPLMWKSGHSLVKARMRESGAQLAGELTGHFFFAERWYGFDDGIYAACRLLEILASDGRTLDEMVEDLPGGIATPELSVAMSDESAAFEFMDRFAARAGEFGNARITSLDGIRADFADGWGLVRSSNTSPRLVMRFEGDNEAALDRIQEQFRKELLTVDAKLQLPF